VIRGMIELAHSVQLTVITEGVEDARTWDWLADANCDAIQGFQLSRPMPVDDLPEWLAAHAGVAQACSPASGQLGDPVNLSGPGAKEEIRCRG